MPCSCSIFPLFFYFKQTVARDFRPPFLIIKSTHQGPWFITKIFFNFDFKVVAFFKLNFDSPLNCATERFDSPVHNAVGSQLNDFYRNLPAALHIQQIVESLYHKMKWGVKSPHLIFLRRDFTICCIMQGEQNDTAWSCSGESNPFTASCRGGIKSFCLKIQREVKYDNGESNKKKQ